jgi:hypothetical protein
MTALPPPMDATMTTVALAGRRIDMPGAASPRFPLANVPEVSRRLRNYLVEREVRHLVCSAACGADLLALEAAEEVGVPALTVVLPFSPASFRQTSVMDRPGDWGPIFDRLIAEVRERGRLVVLDRERSNHAAYAAATHRIIEEAGRFGVGVRACVIWEGASRGASDHSLAFADAARARGWPVDYILTL